MCNSDYFFVIYFVELHPYIILNVSNQIHNFIQGNSAFNFVTCRQFRGNSSQRVIKSANMTKRNVNKTLIHYLICENFCLRQSDRFSPAMVVVPGDPLLLHNVIKLHLLFTLF